MVHIQSSQENKIYKIKLVLYVFKQAFFFTHSTILKQFDFRRMHMHIPIPWGGVGVVCICIHINI